MGASGTWPPSLRPLFAWSRRLDSWPSSACYRTRWRLAYAYACRLEQSARRRGPRPPCWRPAQGAALPPPPPHQVRSRCRLLGVAGFVDAACRGVLQGGRPQVGVVHVAHRPVRFVVATRPYDGGRRFRHVDLFQVVRGRLIKTKIKTKTSIKKKELVNLPQAAGRRGNMAACRSSKTPPA